MARGFGEGCVCMVVMCALLTNQGGYERHIHRDSRRFYRCLALTSTVIVAHLSIVDSGIAIGGCQWVKSNSSCTVSRPCELPLQFV